MRREVSYFLPRLEQSRLMMAWLCPGIEQLTDVMGVDLISAILTGGRSTRLVRELREELQVVLDIDSYFSLQRDSSLFTINVWFIAGKFGSGRSVDLRSLVSVAALSHFRNRVKSGKKIFDQ